MTGESENESREESGAGSARWSLLLITFALLIAGGAGVAFLVGYWTGGSNVFLGCALAGGFGGLGVGVVLWAHRLMRHDELTGPREAICSGPDARAALLADFPADRQHLERRQFLGSLVGLAHRLERLMTSTACHQEPIIQAEAPVLAAEAPTSRARSCVRKHCSVGAPRRWPDCRAHLPVRSTRWPGLSRLDPRRLPLRQHHASQRRTARASAPAAHR